MNRGEPPKRRKPLPPPVPDKWRALQRRSRKPIRAKSAKRAAEDPATAELRAQVAARPCLLRMYGGCAGPGTPHHLEKASAGGATTADNLVPLCAAHNGWVEDHPEQARLMGLVVRPGIAPAAALARRILSGIDRP